MSRFLQNDNFDKNRGSSTAKPSGHQSVLLKEVLEYLDPQPGKNFIDATLNGGGHAKALAEKIQPDGRVLGIEWDTELAKETDTKSKEQGWGDNLIVDHDT